MGVIFMIREFYNKNKEISDIHMVMCGTRKVEPDFKMPPHVREYYLIHYVRSGAIILEENKNKHRAVEGDIFIIYPDNLISYYADNGEVDFCWVSFVGNSVEKYLKYAGVTRENPVIHINNTDFEDTVLKLITLFEKNKTPSEIELNSRLLNCFHSIEKSGKYVAKETVNYIDAVLAYIDDNYMKDISSSDIANFIRLNRSYLFKLFKQQTGMSVSQYLIQYRINKACEFLTEYNFSIGQIARMVGIDDIYYFSKLFKKITGLTPTEYKKRQDS